MRAAVTNDDCAALGLRALAWTLSDGARADRLLALTGLDAATLRARAGDAPTLAATIGFLEANEADLVACAADLGIAPGALVDARERLEA